MYSLFALQSTLLKGVYMQNFLWQDKTQIQPHNELKGDIKTDVLIIGGGICGLLCAYVFKKSGIECVVAEKQKIAQGTTLGTTAKITSLHGLIYSHLTNNFGKETAQKYLHINQTAISEYEKLCKNIPCDFEKTCAYTYSLNDISKIEKEAKVINDLGLCAHITHTSPLPFGFSGAVCLENQAQFDVLKFIKHIAKDLTIYENTQVHEITPCGAICNNGKIFAQKTIVATHFPFINKHGSYFLKLYQHRSYVLGLENAQNVEGMYVDEVQDGLSFRNSGNILLLGGKGSRTGKKCGGFDALTEFKNQYYPNSKIKYRWATQDCMSLDKIPYIGQYSQNTPNLYVATGFNKWGITSSMVSAIVLCDMIRDIKNDCADIFNPSRSILTPQLFVNMGETIANYAIPTTKRCSHLGCALKWNKQEHTWDCSCHGSRFEKDGTVINNPAQKKIKTKS